MELRDPGDGDETPRQRSSDTPLTRRFNRDRTEIGEVDVAPLRNDPLTDPAEANSSLTERFGRPRRHSTPRLLVEPGVEIALEAVVQVSRVDASGRLAAGKVAAAAHIRAGRLRVEFTERGVCVSQDVDPSGVKSQELPSYNNEVSAEGGLATLDDDQRLRLPQLIRDSLGLRPGTGVHLATLSSGEILVTRTDVVVVSLLKRGVVSSA